MDDPVVVGVRNGVGDLPREFSSVPVWQGAIRDSVRQVAAFDEAHRKEVLAVVLPNFVNRHDARMIQAGRGFRFRVEPLHFFVGSQLPAENSLERDHTVELALSCTIDDAHASPRDLFKQLVIAEVGVCL